VAALLLAAVGGPEGKARIAPERLIEESQETKRNESKVCIEEGDLRKIWAW
jgi:hypothetical protein